MYLLLIGLLIQNIQSVSAQPVLTRGEVYDFQPGDVFRIHTYAICGCATDQTEYRIVEQRTQSANGDTVFYVIRRTFGFPTSPAIYWDTLNVFYTNLQQPFVLPGDSIIVSHNFYSDSCGSQRWEQLSIHPPDSVIVYDSLFAYAVKGCGGPYTHWDRLTVSMGCFIHTDLIYYKKGNTECGEIPPTGYTEQQQRTVQSIYPNPSAGTIHWAADCVFAGFELYTADGRMVQCGETPGCSLQLGNCLPGSYILILTDSDGNRYRKPLIITSE